MTAGTLVFEWPQYKSYSIRVIGCKQQKLTLATLRRKGINWEEIRGSPNDGKLDTRHKT